jgi:hypothetical protein
MYQKTTQFGLLGQHWRLKWPLNDPISIGMRRQKIKKRRKTIITFSLS